MTDQQTPPEWVLLEAAKRSGRGHWEPSTMAYEYRAQLTFRALCDMIQKYEQPTVDRKLLCAQEAWRLHDEDLDSVTISVRAIELYLEGFGRD